MSRMVFSLLVDLVAEGRHSVFIIAVSFPPLEVSGATCDFTRSDFRVSGFSRLGRHAFGVPTRRIVKLQNLRVGQM